MRELTPAEREVLTDAAVEAFGDYRRTLGLMDQPIAYSWSNQLTAAAGNVKYNRWCYVIKLSVPILKNVLLEQGWAAAELAVKQTIAHELAHVAGNRKCRNHNREWARRMRLCGYEPNRTHNYTYGQQLFGGDTFRVGDPVEFQYRGEHHSGTIVKKNQKRAVIELAGGTRFNVPYSLLE